MIKEGGLYVCFVGEKIEMMKKLIKMPKEFIIDMWKSYA